MSEDKNRYDLEERTATFGEGIIEFAKKIPVNPVTERLIKQLVGAGTSVGANYCEADDASSKKEFFSQSQRQLKFLSIKKPNVRKRKYRTLAQFTQAFLSSIPEGSLEQSTVNAMEIHLRHLERVLGSSFVLRSAELEDLQGYIDKRSKENGLHGKPLSPITIKRELTTLRTLWNWAKDAGYVSEPLQLKGLRYPKRKEKPPFQTLAEIEKRISRGC